MTEAGKRQTQEIGSLVSDEPQQGYDWTITNRDGGKASVSWKGNGHWMQLIDSAGLKIQAHKRRVRALRRAIKIFERKIEKREPWPGESKNEVLD